MLTQVPSGSTSHSIKNEFGQAAGIVAGLDRFPPRHRQTDWRWGLLHDWASRTNHQDPTTLETQLRFLSDDLRNSHHLVGSAVLAAKTEDEATKA